RADAHPRATGPPAGAARCRRRGPGRRCAPLRAGDLHGDALAARAARRARRGPRTVVVSASEVVWHDLECGSYRADLPLWRELAERSGRQGILEVGAGTGRVALELSGAGHRVTALDHDPHLLCALRERARGGDIETVCADARTF